MEHIIIIILLIIIVLILLDRKLSINIRGKDRMDTEKNLPSVMGKTKPIERQTLPTHTNGRQDQSFLKQENNFESETREEEVDPIDRHKNLDEILVKNEDWEQEEEDWKFDSTSESGFATGVTFQELSTVGQVLQREMLEPDLEQQAVDIIQKIEGTELFDLLERSLGDASKRIARLLRESISNNGQIHSSKRGDSSDSFDIGEFV